MSGSEFRARRQALGLSQTQMAHAIGVPKDTISRWEREKLGIRHPKMLDLALQTLERKS